MLCTAYIGVLTSHQKSKCKDIALQFVVISCALETFPFHGAWKHQKILIETRFLIPSKEPNQWQIKLAVSL